MLIQEQHSEPKLLSAGIWIIGIVLLMAVVGLGLFGIVAALRFTIGVNE